MSSADPQVSACRHCQHYQLQGRRGGLCQKFNAAVESDWSACSLAEPVFSSASDLSPINLPAMMAAATGVLNHDVVPIDTLLSPMSSETVDSRSA
ncbi:hypothetical protein IQ266_26775 [filamentous cyanobacterium LEGE 11480]|uniref:Uncharacterized protein n=1 Tax=Romeriopsis navalis LEGE 11480 TaxID=2777977 RepID=A0A928VRD9_9CYAN|nr:hypothetical protein [Romeriopsis navalis]MBE9033343.1 hypothetical protein [Romeriopsis navalis LEGE 11480]